MSLGCGARGKRSASIKLPQRCHCVPPKSDLRAGTAVQPAFRRNTAERAYTIEAAHNPEVAGSNPAPAIGKARKRGPFVSRLAGSSQLSTLFLPLRFL